MSIFFFRNDVQKTSKSKYFIKQSFDKSGEKDTGNFRYKDEKF